jgi:hypothetical protein
LSACHIRRGARREFFGIDSHRDISFGDEGSGSETHHASAEHCDGVGYAVLEDHLADNFGASPAHRDPGAAVSVVVDDELARNRVRIRSSL